MRDKDTQKLEEAYHPIIQAALNAKRPREIDIKTGLNVPARNREQKYNPFIGANSLEVGYEPKGRGTPYYIQRIAERGPTYLTKYNTLEEVIEILQGLEERTGYRFYAMPDEDIKILKKNKLA